MIDGIKISNKLFDYSNLVENPLLDFQSLVNTDTGEIKCTRYGTLIRIAYYKSLKFTLKENKHNKHTLLIEGSLHKYFNKGKHNFNDFTYQDLFEVLNDLEHKFDLNLDNCVLHNMEFGVNSQPPIHSNKILKGLLSHYNQPFKRISMDSADYYQVQHSNYYIKAYDKARQYRAISNLSGEILRFELKYIRMDDINNLLISKGVIRKIYLTLNDLKRIEVLNVFGEQLLKVWNEILFYDYTIEISDLTNHQKNKIPHWQNINYWEELSKQQRLRQKGLLQKVVDNHSQKVQSAYSNLIQEKLKLLIPKGLPINQHTGNKKGYLLTDNQNGKGLPIDSILNRLNSNQKQFKKNSKKIEVIIPDYYKWINDPRPLPF